MSFLLTGYTGFIGSRILDRILINNSCVTLLGRKKLSNDDVNFFQCDLKNHYIPVKAFSKINTVIHCAGLSHDYDSKFYSSEDYNLVNHISTIRLAKAASDAGVKNFIFLSSVKAAPYNEKILNDENSTSMPEDDYGVSKRNAETELIKLQKTIKMTIVIVRPSLVYGENVTGNLKRMISQIDRNLFPPLPKVNNKRSMVHVDFLIDFILNIVHFNDVKGQIFIIADKKTYSITEIYNSIYFYLKNKEAQYAFPRYFFIGLSIFGDFINKFFYFPFNSKIYKKLFADEYYETNKSERYMVNSIQYNFKKEIKNIISNYKQGK